MRRFGTEYRAVGGAQMLGPKVWLSLASARSWALAVGATRIEKRDVGAWVLARDENGEAA